jgi:hypothetical protein
MDVQPTWRPSDGYAGATRSSLPESAFAFPHERAEPLTDGAHVRSAIARFSAVKHVTDDERDVAFKNIQSAAEYFGVTIHVKSWHELIHGPTDLS